MFVRICVTIGPFNGNRKTINDFIDFFGLDEAIHCIDYFVPNCSDDVYFLMSVDLGYILHTAGRIRDFHPLERALTGRTNETGCAM